MPLGIACVIIHSRMAAVFELHFIIKAILIVIECETCEQFNWIGNPLSYIDDDRKKRTY